MTDISVRPDLGKLAYESLAKFKGYDFETVVADPPWSYNAKGTRLAPDNGKKFKYPTMSNDEIISLPVRDIVAPNAHLYLWATDSFTEFAFQVMRAWGFEFKQFIKWDKVTIGGEPHMGGGSYYRHTFELALFGVRGRMGVLRHDIDADFSARKSQHSRKPQGMYERIEAMSPGESRIELFATQARPGWVTWGNGVFPSALWETKDEATPAPAPEIEAPAA